MAKYNQNLNVLCRDEYFENELLTAERSSGSSHPDFPNVCMKPGKVKTKRLHTPLAALSPRSNPVAGLTVNAGYRHVT